MNQLAITFKAMSLHERQDDAVLAHLQRYGVIDRDFAERGGLSIGKVRNLGQRILELRRRGYHVETDTKTDPANCHYRLIETV